MSFPVRSDVGAIGPPGLTTTGLGVKPDLTGLKTSLLAKTSVTERMMTYAEKVDSGHEKQSFHLEDGSHIELIVAKDHTPIKERWKTAKDAIGQKLDQSIGQPYSSKRTLPLQNAERFTSESLQRASKIYGLKDQKLRLPNKKM